MAGHSKWANIKHRKERADAKKGKLFTRASKEIINAVKLGGPDPKSNTRLRLALQKAKAANLPNDNIARCIKKASTDDQTSYVEMQYELYGHGGVGIIAEVMTDNKNRIASDMRIATNKRGGTIAQPGSVVFNFERKGVIRVPKKHVLEDDLFLIVSENGGEDFSDEGDFFLVITEHADLYTIKEAIEACGCACEASIEMLPNVLVSCDEKIKEANEALIAWLEELDDVDAVYHNMEE